MLVAKAVDPNFNSWFAGMASDVMTGELLDHTNLDTGRRIFFTKRNAGTRVYTEILDISEEQLKIAYRNFRSQYFLDTCLARVSAGGANQTVTVVVLYPRMEFIQQFFTMSRR